MKKKHFIFCLLISVFSLFIFVSKGFCDAVEEYFNKGLYYDDHGNYDEAIWNYTQAIQLEPNNSQLYHNRGLAYQHKGSYDQAIFDYNKALQINPNYAKAYTNRGLCYSSKGDDNQAISDYNMAIRLGPDAKTYYNRGLSYHTKRNVDQAISDYSQAIAMNPRYADAYNNRAVAYFFKQAYDKSWQDVHKLESLGDSVTPKFLEDLKRASGREY